MRCDRKGRDKYGLMKNLACVLWQSPAETMTEYPKDDDEVSHRDHDGVPQGQWWSTTGTMMEDRRDNDGVSQGQWRITAGRMTDTPGTMTEYRRNDVQQEESRSTPGIYVDVCLHKNFWTWQKII